MKKLAILGIALALGASAALSARADDVKLDLRGFGEYRGRIIREAVSEFVRYIPAGQEIVFFSDSDRPGAHTTTGARGTWTVRLGFTTWSRSAAEAHNYPTFGARTDEEMARIVIGHELAHHCITETQVHKLHGLAGGDGEEAATLVSFRLQHIPIRLYEQDISRRFQLYRWLTYWRKTASRQ